MSSHRATFFCDPPKPETHTIPNSVSLKNLLAVVLSIQIALWVLMGLNVLGISIPIVQPLIGFLYLTFVPGILVLAILRMRNLGIVETILYAVGLSLTVVLSIGLVLTIIFDALNILTPFSLITITSSVSFLVLLLCAFTYFSNRTHPKPLFNTKISVPLTPTLFLCIIPFLAVFSTYLVNTYNVGAGQLFLWSIIGVVVLLIAFDKVIPSTLYPLAVFVIAITLLFQQTLISMWLYGADIQSEWNLANAVLTAGIWNPNSSVVQYNGMLSVVVLAPIYSLISNLDLIWVFKIIYPVLFALVPVGLYQIFRKQLNVKVAFLSCFFFMSFATFYTGMITLARQEIAELFFVLLILLLVSKEMDQRIQSALFMVFGLLLVVSHYGLFFIAVLFLFLMWLVLTIARVRGSKLTLRHLQTKIGIHTDKQITAPSHWSLPRSLGVKKDKQITEPSPSPPPRSLVTILTISVLFIAATAWYFYTAQGSVSIRIVSLVSNIAGSIGDLFNPRYSEAVYVVAAGPVSGLLHRVNAFVNYLNVFFMLAGVCLTVFLKNQRFKLQVPYIVLSSITLGFLIASVALPYLGAELNWTRVFQITLIVLAPFLVIGFAKIGEAAGVVTGKVTSKLGFGNSTLVSPSRLMRLLAIYLVFFLLLSNGFLFALTEGYQNMALSTQVDDVYNHETIAGAKWQASNSVTVPLSGKRVTISYFADGVRYEDTSQITDANGQIIYNQTFSSAGRREYYAAFASDGFYQNSTSAIVDVNVGTNQVSSNATGQSTANVSSAAPTITLSASTTIPEVGQPVTFTVKLTGDQVVYGDYYNTILLSSLGIGQARLPFFLQNEIANGSNIFLGTYNIEHNTILSVNFEGVNALADYQNVTSLTSNRSLIYSNGGASVYS